MKTARAISHPLPLPPLTYLQSTPSSHFLSHHTTMAPKKKPTSSAKKKPSQSNPSQPPKYGIQHFFGRLSQNPKPEPEPTNPGPQLGSARNGVVSVEDPKNGSNIGRVDVGQDQIRGLTAQNTVSEPTKPGPKVGSARNGVVRVESSENGSQRGRVDVGQGQIRGLIAHNAVNGVSGKSNCGVNLGSENTPPGDGDDVIEVSPEVAKTWPRKRFKFSPGMIINQSQDDGGEEVTWKISPVNERLQAISKLAPDVVKALADASRLNSCTFQQSPHDTNSHSLKGNADAPSLPTLDVNGKLQSSAGGDVLEKVSQAKDVEAITQSAFRTPPSLSYPNDKPMQSSVRKNGLRECTGLRQHKRALLELLDQVETVISVDKPSIRPCSRVVHENPAEADRLLNEAAVEGQSEADVGPSDPCFLVLEVTEKRTRLISTGAQCSMKVLRVLNEQNGEEQCVHLWDDWFYSIIEPGDTIRVVGEFDNQGNCDVNHEKNFLIVHPNLLLSGTRIAGSFSCPRRAVLDERLKCSEHSTAALLGTLLHQIFQAGMLMEHPTIERLVEFLKIVVQKNIESLFACGVQEKDVFQTLNEAIPKLCDWIGLFMDSQRSDMPAVDFGANDGLIRVSVSDVVDIEEMAWAPKYGLKGMIDASIRVKTLSNGKDIEEKIMPLEFKTGKATSGQTLMEHSAQLILYTLLMSERYKQSIDSGLLYYLSSDQTKGTNVRRSDLIGIIMRRNELAHDIIKASVAQQLPPMLQIMNMCKGCRHLNSCAIYHKVHGGSSESSGLGDLFDSLTDHLTNSHKAFFKQWDRLVDLEAKELQVSNNMTWRSHGLRNESVSSCLSSIVLDVVDGQHLETYANDNKFVYRFVHKKKQLHNMGVGNQDSNNGSLSSENDLQCSLRGGDRVILIAESNHLAVASGVITEISRSHVSVSFSKRLRLPWSIPSSMLQDLHKEVWRISKDEFASSFGIMRFNLVQLFQQSAQSNRLRKLIVDLEAPRFDSGSILSQDLATSYIRSEGNLNADQRRAIIKILTAKDYALILGMPGTGKTSTMVYAVKALLMKGASVLLTSYTNSAVDNLLIKLKAQGIDFVRIGRREVVHKEVAGHCISDMDIHSVDEIRLKLDEVKVVAVTCLGITSPLLANKKFDVCIFDEAGQTSLPVSLGPLMFSSMFVLVGDHYQLPPLVKSTEARENGMSVSLFRRLSEAHPQAISALQSQYRMCAGIMKLSNALIYGDRLRCGSPAVENAKLDLLERESLSPWLEEVLDGDKPVVFIDTDKLPALETKEQKTVNNKFEAHIVAEVTEALVNHGVEKEEIGIITPYNSQANLIQQILNSAAVEVHTIDKYQGRDKDCILVSFVRSSQNPRNCSSSLLGDWHRINVALTRAKKKLIMVGSCKTLARVPLLKLLIEKVCEQSGVFCITRKDIEHKTELKRCSQL